MQSDNHPVEPQFTAQNPKEAQFIAPFAPGASADPRLAGLVDTILATSKYRTVSPDLIRRIASHELAQRRNAKEALKATKNKLHQVAGAYFDSNVRYSAWLAELSNAAQTGKRDNLLQTCRRIMGQHASTRERLPILDRFYDTIFAALPPVRSVVDLACGLNPLALPWMPLLPNAEYYACDIYQDMVNFLNTSITLLGARGCAQVQDLLQSCPPQTVDVAFLLKAIPCLTQLDRSAGYRLLHAIHARHLVVSFPMHSLGGKNKGMPTNYEATFRVLLADTPWSINRLTFPSELVFVVTT